MLCHNPSLVVTNHCDNPCLPFYRSMSVMLSCPSTGLPSSTPARWKQLVSSPSHAAPDRCVLRNAGSGNVLHVHVLRNAHPFCMQVRQSTVVLDLSAGSPGLSFVTDGLGHVRVGAVVQGSEAQQQGLKEGVEVLQVRVEVEVEGAVKAGCMLRFRAANSCCPPLHLLPTPVLFVGQPASLSFSQGSQAACHAADTSRLHVELGGARRYSLHPVLVQSWSSLCAHGRATGALVLELIPGSAVSREASFHSTPSCRRLGRD
jgi:hypothetical protein